MVIGLLIVHISVPYVETIKEKRNRIRSMKDKIRSKFNVSVAEVEPEGMLKGRSRIVVSAVSNEVAHLNSLLSNVFNLLDRSYADIITGYQTDFLQYESESDELTLP